MNVAGSVVPRPAGLRLEGELAEVRAADLKFTLAEARQPLAGAGVELPDAVLAAA